MSQGNLAPVPNTSSLGSLQQQGLLERAFHDGLFPNLAFRAEAMPEEWPANTGQQIFMTRPGLIKPNVKPLKPGTDPTGQSVPFEQWVATLAQYADSIDTNMPTSVTGNANLFLRNIHQLGLQAGQSVNRIARDSIYQAYLSGQTVNTAATLTSDTSVQVAALNGFTSVIIPGGNVPPMPVSPQFPLPITVGTPGQGAVSATVVGYIPNDATDPLGPGVLMLSAAIGTAFAARVPVLSAYAPRIVRAAGGYSVDAIGPGDTLSLQQCINAVGYLRRNNVQPHADGFYHAHISPLANSQVFADPVFQRLNQSLPEHVVYKEGFIGSMAGILFFMNNESPEPMNSGLLTLTTAGNANATYASEMGSEIINGNGVTIGMVLLTGRGTVYEKYLDESAYVTEAGTTGKIGEFDITNNNVQVMTERIRLVIRAPIDKLQQNVTASWSISTSFPIPSDITSPTGPEMYKRSMILQHALTL